MRSNGDMTVYSRGVDPATRTETWARYTVPGVAWEDRRAAANSGSANLQADDIYVYVPMTHCPIRIQAGDVIVRGVVLDVIGGGFSMKALREKYPNVATVRSVDVWDQGSRAMHHYQIGAS